MSRLTKLRVDCALSYMPKSPNFRKTVTNQ